MVPREDLREIFAGEWEGRRFLDLKKEDPEAFGLWLNNLEQARCTGGESVIEMQQRLVEYGRDDFMGGMVTRLPDDV